MPHIQVLLTENVAHLGAEADIVRVRRGYARNFLIPTGKALELTPSALHRVNYLKAKRAEREARELQAAHDISAKISKLKLSFELETGETGKAFGSITAKDIHDRLIREISGLQIEKHAVELDRAIKETGLHDVRVRLHPEVVASLKIHVAARVNNQEEKKAEQADAANERKPAKRKKAE